MYYGLSSSKTKVVWLKVIALRIWSWLLYTTLPALHHYLGKQGWLINMRAFVILSAIILQNFSQYLPETTTLATTSAWFLENH